MSFSVMIFKMKNKAFITITLVLFALQIRAQTVELYAGHERAGVDLMWFKFFQNPKGERSPFLYFSRNRASADYKNSPTAFGSTNAVSYNFRNGVGIVAVGSFVNAGLIPKAGVQYVKTQGDFLFFGWLVADLKKEGNLDLFGMFRWQPPINERWRWFSQLELFPVYKPASEEWNLTQRLRLGAKYQAWAAGGMADFNQSGPGISQTSANYGVFLRRDF